MKKIPKLGKHGGSLICVVAKYDDGTEKVLTGAEVAAVDWEAEAVRLQAIVDEITCYVVGCRNKATEPSHSEKSVAIKFCKECSLMFDEAAAAAAREQA